MFDLIVILDKTPHFFIICDFKYDFTYDFIVIL